MQLMTVRRAARGDTLIEVLLAITIFSAAAVGAIFIMNRGIATEQQSLEITQVRNQIDSQAELLRHLNNLAITASGRVTAGGSAGLDTASIAAQWYEAIDRTIIQAPSFEDIQTLDDCKPEKIALNATKPFFINTKTGRVVPIPEVAHDPVFKPTQTFSQIRDSGVGDEQWSEMLWVYVVNSGGSEAGRGLLGGDFYDFHIRACWESPGDGGVQKLGTIVRIYAP